MTEHIVEVISDSGEGAQRCGQSLAAIAAKMGNGIWTVEIIPAEIQPPARSVEGAGPGPEGNVTKLKLSDHMIEGGAITAALAGPETALHDGAGALAGRLVMSARAMAIAGGTSEVQKNVIGERILGLPRERRA